MPHTTPILPQSEMRSRWVRAQTLITLRWLAVLGQIVALSASYYGFNLKPPLIPCAIIISAAIAFNLVSVAIFAKIKRLGEDTTLSILAFDLVQLGALLYFTGGLTNPFAVLLLTPMIIASTALSLRAIILLGALSLITITLLYFFFQPLLTAENTIISVPALFRFGSWLALGIAIIFISGYARRVSFEIFGMGRALAATQLALAREQQLSSMAGITASLAHEMGTPLATIKLVAREMRDELDDEALRDDVELIATQADRCRDILRNMSKSGKEDLQTQTAPVIAILEEAAEPHINRERKIIFRLNGSVDDLYEKSQPVIPRKPELIHGLRNLIQNAVDFAHSTVWIDIETTKDTLRISIGDDGAGYPSDIIDRIGDPIIKRKRMSPEARPEYEGMGLGLFIAKTLLERTGAQMAFVNGQKAENSEISGLTAEELEPTGAIAHCSWILSKIVV